MNRPFWLLSLLLAACDTGTDTKETTSDADGDGFVDDDCDDNDASINPDAPELCDEVDNNCDGTIDEDTATDAATWYQDSDADGIGAADSAATACDQPSGYVDTSGDCDDNNANIFPGNDEVCDGIDNDCDTYADNNAVDAPTWYADSDADGYGDPDSSVAVCVAPAGYIKDATDCDDSSAAIRPGVDEYCDDIDNNCDGTIDEDKAVDTVPWYRDSDGDGNGDPKEITYACDAPSGYVGNDEDCDDTDAKDSECRCTLDGVGAATDIVSSGSVYGAWMADPMETLGSGLYWEMDTYYGTTVTEFSSLADLTSRTGGTAIRLTTQYEGTGAVVYDGYLYYAGYDTNTIHKFDLDLGTEVDTLTISDAGFHNTYHYGWGGFSDIDLAVDENGLWVIYSTAANSGRLVISQIDTKTFSLLDTWETTSAGKTGIGNAFVICGVLYATSSYSSSAATINFAFNTEDETSWDPGISMPSTHSYIAQIDYNPNDGLLYIWDYQYRVTRSTTLGH